MARKKTDTKLAVDNWAKGNQETAHHRKAIQLMEANNAYEATQNVTAVKDPTRIRLTVLKFTPKIN